MHANTSVQLLYIVSNFIFHCNNIIAMQIEYLSNFLKVLISKPPPKERSFNAEFTFKGTSHTNDFSRG